MSSSKNASSLPTTSAFSSSSLPDAGPQPNDPFDPIGGQEAVTQNPIGLLTDPIDAASPLDQPDDGPREIEVHDDSRILQVLAFAEHVGGDQNVDLVLQEELRPRLSLLQAGLKRQASSGRIIRVAGDGGQSRRGRVGT